MKETETTALFKRVGRKYVPVEAVWYEDRDSDHLQVNTFRLTYAYASGGRKYEYEVTPETAPMVAAMMIAKTAMEKAIREASKMRPSGGTYTKKQQALIAKFREDMGGMYPSWWTERSSYEISEAAMRAVMEYRP